ncbi:MAG: molybdopterin-dependent oxidoreductase [Coriobacteriia bacterium]|nr:molybdopterin-dependent oxidoreductase [Coriobacteriia bacterium]
MSERIVDCGDGVIKFRTCAWSPPGDHPVGCGMYLHVKDGKVVKVEGDPEHPITNGRLCVRCLTLPEYMYHKDRIIYPMKRAREDRGKDKWERITWDEALDIIEERVNHIKAEWGAEAIVAFQGTGREATLYKSPLAYAALGTPNSCFPMSGDSCYGPRVSVADFLLGAGYPELDYAAYFPDRYDHPGYEVPKYILMWGKDPLFSNPDGFFGHAIIDLMKRGTKFITVDPRLTWIGVRAEYHLQLRPGTDAALGLGMLNVIISEDLYDHDFVEKWCYGFKALAARAAEYDLDTVEKITWVPKETIAAAARAFATNSPSSAMWGLAIDTNTNGVQAGHAFLALVAITGNFDIPGGVTLAVPASFMGKWRYECAQQLPPGMIEKQITDPKYVGFTAAHVIAHPDCILDTLETEKPYPLKMAWFYSSNLLANTSAAQPKRWYDALKRLEFNVVNDLFMTPTAMALCDLFLPMSTFAEHDGIVLPHFGRNTHAVMAMNKAVTVGECISDLELDFLVGKRLNPKAWPWETVSDFFTEQIKPSLGVTFPEFQDIGVIQQKFEYKKYEKGLLRSDGEPGFNTPTGMIELKSSLYPGWGEDALPYFEEPVYSQISKPEDAERYPLVMTTGGRNTASFHSEHRQIASLRAITPDAIVQIHPDTAAAYGIEEGDWVLIENQLGCGIEKAHLSPIVDPRVVHAAHGWWYPEQEGEEPNLFGVWKSSINSMIPHKTIGKLGFGAPYKNVMCQIRKVDSFEIPVED